MGLQASCLCGKCHRCLHRKWMFRNRRGEARLAEPLEAGLSIATAEGVFAVESCWPKIEAWMWSNFGKPEATVIQDLAYRRRETEWTPRQVSRCLPAVLRNLKFANAARRPQV